MIKTYNALLECIEADSINFKSQNANLIIRWKNNLNSTPINDQKYIWKYIKTMRYLEYHLNSFGILHKFCELFYKWKLRKLSYKTGFQIPPNTCGKGLTIWHWGNIIINPHTQIGEFCTLNSNVLIGHKEEGQPAPQIGNNVFIGSGSKIIGDIKINDNVIIGPNTIIVKNIPKDAVVVGNPARIIRIGMNQVNIKL